MPDGLGTIQTDVRDLKQLVKLAVQHRQRRRAGRQARPLLFLGPHVPLLPASVLEDSMLTHRERLVWLTLRLRLTQAAQEHTLPRVRELAARTDIGGKDTMNRCFYMLRCRRYLSVCATAWHGGGQKAGTAYALHAPRLNAADVLFLDPDYLSFLQYLSNHATARLREAAEEEILALADPS